MTKAILVINTGSSSLKFACFAVDGMAENPRLIHRGIIGARYPTMQMISFGPNIRGAHSPDERVQISSVQKFWCLLLEALQRMPAVN